MKTLIPAVLLGVALLGIVVRLALPEDNGCPGGVCPVKTPLLPPKTPPMPKKPLKPKPH